MGLRSSPSVDKNGQADGSGNGYSWFPGFVINSETGERLNIIFGENSADTENNGHDMIWNPTSNLYDSGNNLSYGGAHYIYIMNTKYGGDNEQNNPYYVNFQASTNTNLRNIYKDVNWVSMPLLKPGASLLDGVTHITLNIAKQYDVYETGTNLGHNNPLYQFNKNNISHLPENTGEANWLVYPNPSDGVFQLSFGQRLDEPQLLKIYNLSGQIVVQSWISDRTSNIDLSHQPNGVYLYKIDDKKPQTGKLILYK